jgi:N-acetylneuraminate synthase
MKPFLTAEAGINHSGDLSIAKSLIKMAKDCGCDAVKFQKRNIETVYTKEFLDSPRESPWGKTQREQKQGLEFGKDEYDDIDKYCKEFEIEWFASAWDLKSLEFLRQYNLPFNKIASAMLTNEPFIRAVAEEGKHTFISTGMAEWDSIDKVVRVFEKFGTSFVLLHCVSIYPCPDEWCNIRMVDTLKRRYGYPVGYSGHETGILPSVLAVSLGAEVIERHVTLDRSSYGSDQSASLEKHGLELLVRDCRDVYKMLGTGEKVVLDDEIINARKLRYWE